MPDSTIYYISDSAISKNGLQEKNFDTEFINIEENSNHFQTQKERDKIGTIQAVFFILFLVIVLVHAIYKLFKNEKVATTLVYTTDCDSINTKNYLVYNGVNFKFSRKELQTTLLKYHPYYQQLNPLLQSTFIDRLKHFIENKVFVIYAKEGYKEMPILLSAAAIQITFGLKDYLLPYFKYLKIHPEEYFAENSLRVLEGHVQGNSITIAFNRLLKGNSDYTDGANVALHEMAHALYYQEIEVNKTPQDQFDALFEKVLKEGEETFEQKENNTIYTNYAFTNLQEFWAESIEIFFEKPATLKSYNAELFAYMQMLLQQNPLSCSNPVIADSFIR